MSLHIHRTDGHFIGQRKGRSCRKWETVTRRCKTSSAALIRAVRKSFSSHYTRLRVLYVPTGENGSWYEPHVCLEVNRR